MSKSTKYMFMFHGYSGCGKSKACEYMEREYRFYNLHPIAFLKRQLEEHYDIPEGSLDTVEGKNYTPPGANYNMQQIMVNIYHFWKANDPLYATRNVKNKLTQYLPLQSIAMQAIRNQAEIDCIVEFSDKNPLVYIGMTRYSAIKESSDDMFETIQKQAQKAAYVTYKIDNNDTIQYLYEQIDGICLDLGIEKINNENGVDQIGKF